MTNRRSFLRAAGGAALAAATGARAAATGYVRVERIDGVWWFVGPDGERFVSLYK